MSWYLSRRLMACRVNEKLSSFEEDFFVVEASSRAMATKEARSVSKAAEHAYENGEGGAVTWRLHELSEVLDLGAARLKDGMWLYRREFPGLSQLAKRSRDRVRVTSRFQSRNGTGALWFGAMLLFRGRQKPIREEERLLLLRAPNRDHATSKAFHLSKNAAENAQLDLMGMFDIGDLFDKSIRSGTEIYWRFFSPVELRQSGQPPRETHLTVPEFSSARTRARASA